MLSEVGRSSSATPRPITVRAAITTRAAASTTLGRRNESGNRLSSRWRVNTHGAYTSPLGSGASAFHALYSKEHPVPRRLAAGWGSRARSNKLPGPPSSDMADETNKQNGTEGASPAERVKPDPPGYFEGEAMRRGRAFTIAAQGRGGVAGA